MSLENKQLKIRNIKCQRPPKSDEIPCNNTQNQIILHICEICNPKHQYIRCSKCGYEWNEFI